MAFLTLNGGPNKSSIQPAIERLYLMEFIIDGEVILKCGKASGKDSTKRLMQIISSFYNFYRYTPIARILRDVEVTDVFKKETEFHHWFSAYRYHAANSFDGHSELFKVDTSYAFLKFDDIVGKASDRPLSKTCYTCKQEKLTIDFHSNKAKKDGLNHKCKGCVNQASRDFNKIHTRMYGNQVSHSKTRGHPRPTYSAADLKTWLHTQPLFAELYAAYKDSGYNKSLVPSVDRTDPDKPYTISNIKLMSFLDNMKRNAETQGINSQVPVWQICSISGEFIAAFESIAEAGKVTGICPKGISRALTTGINKYGRLSTTSGMCWIEPFNWNLLTEDRTLLRKDLRGISKVSNTTAEQDPEDPLQF